MSKTTRLSRPLACLLNILIFAAAISLYFQSAFAQTEADGFLHKDFLISIDVGDKFTPDVAYNSRENSWLVVLSDLRVNNTSHGIYGWLVDAEYGYLKSGLITVLDNSTTLINPAVAYDALQNRWLVVWENMTDGHIEGQILNSDGIAYENAFLIAGSATTEAWEPDVAYNNISDEYLVVWTQSTSGGTADVYARKVGNDGVVDPGGSFPIAATSLVEAQPAVQSDQNLGRYLVVWRTNSGGNLNIFGQRLLSTGAASGGAFPITLAAGNDYAPQLAFDPAYRRALVVWYNSDLNIYGALVSSNNTVGPIQTINSLAGNSSYPSVTFSSKDTRFLVAWQQGTNINGRWMTYSGTLTPAQFAITSYVSTHEDTSVAYGNEEYLTAWHDERYSHDEIYGSIGYWRTSIYLPLITH